MKAIVLPLAATLLLAGCATSPPAPVYEYGSPAADRVDAPSRGEPSTADGTAILEIARAQLGTPYLYGGNDPRRGFDCSGLVAFTHDRNGIAVPRTAHAQSLQARPVDPDAAREGDLLFFVLDGRRVSHVGIYAGDGRFIHAPKSGGRVSYASLDNPYWQQTLSGAGRFTASR